MFLVLTLYHIIHGRLHGGAEHNIKRTDLVKWDLHETDTVSLLTTLVEDKTIV